MSWEHQGNYGRWNSGYRGEERRKVEIWEKRKDMLEKLEEKQGRNCEESLKKVKKKKKGTERCIGQAFRGELI